MWIGIGFNSKPIMVGINGAPIWLRIESDRKKMSASLPFIRSEAILSPVL